MDAIIAAMAALGIGFVIVQLMRGIVGDSFLGLQKESKPDNRDLPCKDSVQHKQSDFSPTKSHAPVAPSASDIAPYATLSQNAPFDHLDTTGRPASSSRPSAVHENAIYTAIANELESGQTDKGLWTRLYAENDGDEKKTRVAYIKLRAEKMIGDI